MVEVRIVVHHLATLGEVWSEIELLLSAPTLRHCYLGELLVEPDQFDLVCLGALEPYTEAECAHVLLLLYL